jgi:hypothetical protein
MGIFRTLDEDYDLFSIENQIEMLRRDYCDPYYSQVGTPVLEMRTRLYQMSNEDRDYCEENNIKIGSDSNSDISPLSLVPFISFNTMTPVEEINKLLKNIDTSNTYIIIKEEVEYPTWYSLPIPLKKYQDIVPEILRPLYE